MIKSMCFLFETALSFSTVSVGWNFVSTLPSASQTPPLTGEASLNYSCSGRGSEITREIIFSGSAARYPPV